MPRTQNKNTSKVLLVLALSLMLIFLLFYYNVTSTTAFVGADVGIKDKIQGAILLGYNSSINLTSTQIITTEFVNTGTSNYTARIGVTIYMYNNTSGSLEQLGDYYDNSVSLNPGERKIFNTIFLPSRVGVYYIKARVPYDSKTAETWGSFYVTFTYVQIPQIIYVVTQYGGGTVPAQKEMGITGLELDYKDKVDLYPGQKTLLSIRLNNTGTVNLHNLKFYSSTTDYINFEVNPKEVYELGYNGSTIFLVSLEVSNNTPDGEYDFSFEVMGLEIVKNGNIKLNVTSLARKPLKDEVYETILNYEYLITELDHEIYTTSLNGFNTSRAETYLDDAKKNLQAAKDYYSEEKYDDANDVLDRVKRDLENVVFELATISFRVYVYPVYSPFLILILVIMIIIAILILIFLYRRRKKKKPKLIREFTEEET
jgi:hypothetical protein